MAINFDHSLAGDIQVDSNAAETMRIDTYTVFHTNNYTTLGTSFLRADASDSFTGANTWNFAAATTLDFDDGATVNFNMTTGTSPFTVDSTTLVTNLNADQLDGLDGGSLLRSDASDNYTTGTLTFDSGTAVVFNNVDVDFNTQLPQSSIAPTNANDLVNKTYVDNIANGLSWKEAVRVATIGNITLSGTQTIDGVGVVADDRVLVKNQSTLSQNGIYVVAAGAWSRATDADTWDELVSAAVFVSEGTTNQDVAYVCTVDAGGTLNTTDVTWTQFTGTGTVYTAGDGLSESPAGTFNVNAGAGLIINVDDVDVQVGEGIAIVTDTVQLDITSLTTNTDILDADSMLIYDSANTSHRDITWANVKAALGADQVTVSDTWTFSAAPDITDTGTQIGPNGDSSPNGVEGVLSMSSGQFAAAGDAQAVVYVLRRQTTDATQSVLTTNGSAESASNTMIMPNDTTWGFRVTIAARRADVDGESASYEFKGSIKRDTNAASTAIVGTVVKNIYAESTTAWDAAVDAETTNGSLRVQVTGEAAKTIRWVAHVEIIQSTG